MTIPLARTKREEHLYRDLNPCHCGETAFRRTSHATGSCQEGLTSISSGDCPSCGAARRFEFRVPDWPDRTGGFGGDDPSQIIDAGQWRMLGCEAVDSVEQATRSFRRVPAGAALEEIVRLLRFGVECLEEIPKFIPAGTDRVPVSAFWTDSGRRQLELEPLGIRHFEREMLEAFTGAYRNHLSILERP